MTSPNVTIKPKVNLSSLSLRQNKQHTLLNHLKKIEDSKLMVDELKKLIQIDKLKNFQLDPVQLKAILSLFSEHHLFIALQLLVEYFATTLNINELKSNQLKPTQLISILSLFHTLNRVIAFKTLLKLFTSYEPTTKKSLELTAAQLKAILFLFDNSDRFEALNHLKNHFDVKVHLTENDIKDLEACLSRDRAFTNLSAFSQKKIWNVFYPKQEELPNDSFIQNKNKSNIKAKNLKLPFVDQLPRNLKRIKVSEPISIHIIESKQKRLRFEYFKNYIKAHGHQAIVFKNIKEFERFIKVFPPHDAIEFLNLPCIKSQIKDLQQRNLQFSKETYSGLLNYLKNDSVKKLLRPISPLKETKFLKFDICKSGIDQQEKISYESDTESLWEKIEEQLENTIDSNQNFYYFIKKEIGSHSLTFINHLEKLRIILIGLPCEKRFEIFSLPKIQEILNNFSPKKVVQLYKLFPPEHSFQFLNSETVSSRLTEFSLSYDERKDIISYFPNATMKNLVRTQLNTVSCPLFFKNPIYDFNQDSRFSSSEDEGYRSGNVSPQI